MTLLLKDVQLKDRLKFGREHVDINNIFRRQILWSDEPMIELFSLNDEISLERKKMRDQLSEKYHSYCELWWWIDNVME